MHRAKRVVLTHPGGQALLGRCLVRAISDGARQGLALWPPARSLKRCARVIAVLLRQARSWPLPAHLFLSPGIFRAQALHCPEGAQSVCRAVKDRSSHAAQQRNSKKRDLWASKSPSPSDHIKCSPVEKTMGKRHATRKATELTARSQTEQTYIYRCSGWSCKSEEPNAERSLENTSDQPHDWCGSWACRTGTSGTGLILIAISMT